MEEEVKITEPVKRENVFKNKNFTLTFLGALVSNIGAIFYDFAVSFYILNLTDNNAVLQGLYLFMTGLIHVLVASIGGVIADRFNKAKIMSFCDFLKGFLILSLMVLCLVFNNPSSQVIFIFVVGFFTSLISAFFSPASASLLPLIVEDYQIQQAQSYYSVLSSFQGIVGMILAGILYSSLSMPNMFLVIGVCYILSGISEIFIRYNHVKKEDKLTLRTTFTDLKDGFKYFVGQKAIFYLITFFLFINFFLTPITSNFLTYFVNTEIKTTPDYLFNSFLEPEMWSAIIAIIFGVSSLIGSLILSAKEQKEKVSKSVKIIVIIFALVMLLASLLYLFFIDLNKNLNVFLISFLVIVFMMGILIVNINIPVSTTVTRKVDKEKLGKVSSLISMASMGLTPIASFVAGYIINYLGSSALLIGCSIGLLITAFTLLFNKKVNEL